jgi:hypothetical protein
MTVAISAVAALAIGLAIGLAMPSSSVEEEPAVTVEPPLEPPENRPAPKAGLLKIAVVIALAWWLGRRARKGSEAGQH